ncbi:MAG: LPS export ABC transporter permease LptG [Pseudomonadota bacterium]
MTPPATLFRYIALRAAYGVGGLLIVLALLILLIDFLENMRYAEKFEHVGLGFAVQLTLLRAPSILEMLAPFVFLFGSIWMFHQLNKRSELSVMRAAGLSVWRLIGPAAVLAAIAGVVIITIIDPVSSQMRAYAETLKAETRGASSDLVKVFKDGIWLRQKTDDASIVINATTHDRAAGALMAVTVWRFTANHHFVERLDASRAVLSGETLELHDVLITAAGDAIQRQAPIYALQTSLTSEDLNERIQSPETVSLWRLPRFIRLAEAAGLPTTRYEIRFHDLLSTPLKLIAMILIAAAFSMRPVRSGGQLQLVVLSIGAGFLLYVLSAVSTALGESEIAPVALAAWAPGAAASLAAITALLRLEDG